MKKIAVLTSGGDAPGMNAAIRSVVRSGISAGLEVHGIYKGYEGLIDDDIRPLQWSDLGNVLHTGGTILRTARSDRFRQDEWIDKAAQNLRYRGIEGVVVIGGDGTFNGGLRLSERGIGVVGVPATIDNDLGYTDYTIGFDTAVNTALDLISKIRDTSSSHFRTTIIEVMGRNCGDIALYAGLGGGADVILVPEVPVDIQDVVDRARSGKAAGKLHNIIVKAEGSDYPLDELAELIEGMTGQETRSVVPGYIQRGGSPSGQDRILASTLGAKAVEILAAAPTTKDIKSDPSLATEIPSVAVGVSGIDVIAVPLYDAIHTESKFRKDLYELAITLS